MSEMSDRIAVLQSEFAKTRKVLDKIHRFYCETRQNINGEKDRTVANAIVLAEIFTNYYTCLETLFLRVSQFFENDLEKEKWHKDLLNKMTLEVAGVRKQLLRDELHSILLEFLQFRHFRRYYFEFEYDWEKLLFLESKYNRARDLLEEDLASFLSFLGELQKS